MVDREVTCSNSSTQTSCWVQTCTGVVDADQVSNEKGDTDTDWGKVVQGGLFDNSHQDGDTQDTGTESLNHQTSTLGAAASQGVSKEHWTRGHGTGSTTGSHTGNKLGTHHAEALDSVDGSGKHQREGDSRVQVTTRDSGGEEDTDHDTETETKRNHDNLGWVGAVRSIDSVVVGSVGNHVGTPKEDKGTDEFTGDDHQQVLEGALEAEALEFAVSWSNIFCSSGVTETLFCVHCECVGIIWYATDGEEKREKRR